MSLLFVYETDHQLLSQTAVNLAAQYYPADVFLHIDNDWAVVVLDDRGMDYVQVHYTAAPDGKPVPSQRLASPAMISKAVETATNAEVFK